MNMASVPTFTATIYCGLAEGYGGKVHHISEAKTICREYCDKTGLGVTVIPLDFIYQMGGEIGIAVGLINYPRFPKKPEDVKYYALALAELLKTALGQIRVSVVCSDETITMEEFLDCHIRNDTSMGMDK